LECGGNWDYYFREQNYPLTQSSGISEENFDERIINNEAILLIPPMAQCALDQIGGDTYLESVSFRGTNTTGNFSILVPEKWNLLATDTVEERTEKLLRHKKSKELTRTLKLNSDLKFNINITNEVMETIYDPLGYYTQWTNVKFGGSYLLAKTSGVFVAEQKFEYNTTVNRTASFFSLKPKTINNSVELIIENIEWTRVNYEDLEDYNNENKVFAVNDDKVYFSGGQIGNRITTNIVAVNLLLYCKEVPLKTYYPSGYIALDLTEEQKTYYTDKNCYIVINYYNAPSNYNEIKTPIIDYFMPKTSSNRSYFYTENSYEWDASEGWHGAYSGFTPVANLPSVVSPLTPTAIAGEEFV